METADGGSLTAKDLFTVQMMETDTERLSTNLAGWTLTSITATEVKLALKFIEPIKVSQGDEFDAILVFAGLGSF